MLNSIKTFQTATNTNLNHIANQVHRDSLYLHDSIFVRICHDNVYLEKWHTRWRDRETIKTDTVLIESVRVDIKEVRCIPRFYKYCTTLAIILFLIFLLRVMFYLYKNSTNHQKQVYFDILKAL